MEESIKVLHLTLKRKWFRLIASGEKTYELRDSTPYWERRLLHGPDGTPNEYDEIHFRSGYAKDAPFMRVKCNGLALTGKKWFTPKHGEEIAELVIIIRLGPVLDELLHDTGDGGATLFRIDDDETWIPNSLIDDLFEEDKQVAIPRWFAKKEALI